MHPTHPPSCYCRSCTGNRTHFSIERLRVCGALQGPKSVAGSLRQDSKCCVPKTPAADSSLVLRVSPPDPRLIPKLFLRLLWLFWRSESLFRQNRGFPQLFRFCSDLGNPGIWQIVRNSMLTGRWWEGRILINLCGKNNVRNCDLLQSDFFARCRTVLGVAKGFFWYVVKFGKMYTCSSYVPCVRGRWARSHAARCTDAIPR